MAGQRQSSRATKAPVKYSPPSAPAANPRKRTSEAPADGNPAPKRARTTKKATGTAGTTGTTNSKKSAKAKTSAKGKTSKGAAAKKSDTKKSTNTKASKVSKPKANMAVKRNAATEGRARPVKKGKPLAVINSIPTKKLDIFVVGEGGMGELGLGTSEKAIDVKRPRLNPYLAIDKAGVIKLAVGGMHCVALTHDNKILTWGVNDQGALGRDTSWSGGLVSIDDDADGQKMKKEPKDSESEADSEDNNGLNPKECVPIAIPAHHFPDDVHFVDAAAADSASFVLTSTGLVYGWGVFRGSNGPVGFDKPDLEPQRVPMLIEGLKNIKKVVCGANHAYALDKSGTAYGWGCGEQHQLGRKLVERTSGTALKPSPLPLPQRQIRDIFSGSDHGFAIKKNNDIFSWGVNSFCETGHNNKGAEGADNLDTIIPPKKVTSLAGQNILYMEGGNHHTVALNDKSECLTFGCADYGIAGIPLNDIPDEDCVFSETGAKRIVLKPTVVTGVKDVAYVAAGTDHSIAITKEGKAYTWGFSANYQTAQGTDDDVLEAALVDNNAIRDRQLVSGGGGGQFSCLTATAA